MSTSDDPSATPLVHVIGQLGCAAAYTIRDFLTRSDVPFKWTELADATECLLKAGVQIESNARLPVCIFPDGTRLDCPTVRQITEKLGWFRDAKYAEYDLAIFGAGPAGLSAAVYGASEGLKTVLVERFAVGGQAGSSSKIENYLGFPDGIKGAELAERAREQAYKFGAEILLARSGVSAEFLPGRGVVTLDDGTKIVARASICSTGVEYRRLGLPDEDRFLGAGLHYGAGASEASLTKDQHVVVVGAGNSAGQATMHFSPLARQVTLVVRGDCLAKTLSQYLVDRIRSAPNVEVLHHTEVTALHGNGALREVSLTHRREGSVRRLAAPWLFACIGGSPHTDWADQVGVVRDEAGYLVTGPDLTVGRKRPPGWPLNREPYYLETSVPGVFAAGDVRHGSVKRCASAVGEGAMAVALVHRYLAEG